MSKDTLIWNTTTDKNISECLKLVNSCDFKELKLSNDIEDFILNLLSNHHCDSKVLFFVILAGIGHFGEAIKLYNMEVKQARPVSVYEVLIAPSGTYNNEHQTKLIRYF